MERLAATLSLAVDFGGDLGEDDLIGWEILVIIAALLFARFALSHSQGLRFWGSN
jgi:hypothetical protein